MHGGPRPGAGRKPRSGAPGRNFTLRLAPEVEAELADGLLDGETIADVLRDGGLARVRERAAARKRKESDERLLRANGIKPR